MELTPAAERDLRRLDPHVRKQVVRDILKLEQNPRPSGIEALTAKEKLYRVYVGPGKTYRAIFEIQDEVLLILVVRVGHRKEVYRGVK